MHLTIDYSHFHGSQFPPPFPPLLTFQICTLLSIDDEFEVREAFRIIYGLDDYVVQGEMIIIAKVKNEMSFLHTFHSGHIDSHPKLVYKFSQLYTAGSALPVTIIVFFVRRKVRNKGEKRREWND